MPRSFNRTLLFINSIFALAAAGVLLAQDASATLSGQVRPFPDGSFPGLTVELTLEHGPGTIFSVRADDDGKFEFTVLPQGSYTLRVAQMGFGTVTVKSIWLASEERKILPPLRLYVTPTDVITPVPEFLELRSTDQDAGNLSGRVTRDEDRSITQAMVRLLCDDKICGETKTDANFKFVFFNLAPRDDYTILVLRAGYYPWQGIDYKIEAGYDATYRSIVILPRVKLSRAASTVR